VGFASLSASKRAVGGLRSTFRAAGCLAFSASLFTACGSGGTPPSANGLSDSQLRAVQNAFDLLGRTGIPSRVVAISFQVGEAPTTCSVVPLPSNGSVFRLYVAWEATQPGFTMVPKSVLEATITQSSSQDDQFNVFTFQDRKGNPKPASVSVSASLTRAALTKPNAQCQVLEDGHLQLVPSSTR